MQNEDRIRKLMRSGMDDPASTERTRIAVSRARRQVGNRDTLTFALVRIWAALARLLAPVFARFGEHQARAIRGRPQVSAASHHNIH